MASFNRVILMGNLTRDPELRYTPNGKAVASFTLAVNRRWKQDDQVKEEAGFFDIVVFGKQAENCSEYLKKGRPVLVEGYLQQRKWETDEGQKRSKIEIVALTVQFLGSGRAQTGGEGGAPEKGEGGFSEEDIPF